jgi:hypothetical protein
MPGGVAGAQLNAVPYADQDLLRRALPIGPVLRDNPAYRQLQGVINHNRHEDKTHGRISSEYQMCHRESGGQGLFGAAEDGGYAILRR